MFGKSLPSTTRSCSAASRGNRPTGKGATSSKKSVNAMVVSRCTRGYISARVRSSRYSGAPRWATTAVSCGCRRSTPSSLSGPVPRAGFTGPDKLEGVLRRHPQLTAVVAHLGAPEYPEFLTLAEMYPRVHLDTTMAFTDFFEEVAPFPVGLLPRLAALQERVVLGLSLIHISEPTRRTPISYAVFCLHKKKQQNVTN